MLETSKDLFYIVLAFCILWLTVFLCWALYYFIRMLKQMSEVMRDIKDRIERVSNVMNFLKSKIVSIGLQGIMKLFSNWREGVKKKSKNQNPKTKS